MVKIIPHSDEDHIRKGVLTEDEARKRTKKIQFKKLTDDVMIGVHPHNRGILFLSIKYKKGRVKIALPVQMLQYEDEDEVWDEKHQEVE